VKSFLSKDAVVVGFLLVVFATLGITSFLQKAPAWDEPYHLVRGYLPLRDGIFSLSTTHPPLSEILTAIPLIFFQEVKSPPTQTSDDFRSLGYNFLWRNNADPQKMLYACRLVTIFLGILLGWVIYLWSRKLWGVRGGVFSLFFYALSPTILAHARLATNDVACAFFIFLSFYFFWRWYREMRRRYFYLGSIVASLALVSKFSAVVIIPFVFIFIVAANRVHLPREKRKQLSKDLSRILIFSIIVLLVIAASYGFTPKTIPVNPQISERVLAKTGGLARPLIKGIYFLTSTISLPWNQYLRGFEVVLFEYAQLDPYPAFCAGKISRDGFWYFFLITFLIKTPLATLILLGASCVLLKRLRSDYLFILPFMLTFFILASLSKLQIGLRHLLPIYPFIFLWLGGLSTLRWKWKKVFLTVICLWYVAAHAAIYPHYLAYFNELIGGPKNGYKYLVDSNLDWGQDLKGLKHYMEKHGIDKINLSYFGMGLCEYYGIDYEYLPSPGGLTTLRAPRDYVFSMPQEGLIAVSATNLQGVYFNNPGIYDWLKSRKPKDYIGYSILIYDAK